MVSKILGHRQAKRDHRLERLPTGPLAERRIKRRGYAAYADGPRNVN
jgi:hypothetical protein